MTNLDELDEIEGPYLSKEESKMKMKAMSMQMFRAGSKGSRSNNNSMKSVVAQYNTQMGKTIQISVGQNLDSIDNSTHQPENVMF